MIAETAPFTHPKCMKICHSISELPPPSPPCGITIGVFDGLHKGHVVLLKQLIALSSTSVVVTFNNHPYTVFPGKKEPLSICSLHHKLAFLEKIGISITLLLTFTKEIANLTYEEFLKQLYDKLHFSYLILGKGAAFGKGGQGTEEALSLLATKWGFQASYLPKLEEKGSAISSSRIRGLLLEGKIEEAEELLGKPFEPSVLKNFRLQL